MRRTLAVLLFLASAAPAADLAHKIRGVLESSAVAREAFWGIRIVGLDDGKIVFETNADHKFVPASNTKLFTTAMGLVRLGPDYRFYTTVVADEAPDADGVVKGAMRLVGGGDPNLSARAIPYRTGPPAGEPLQAIEDLADQVVARGVRRIEGDVVGDDTAYVWDPFPPGWALDDPIWDYGAPISALTINDNAFSLTVLPGEREGDPARVLLSPALEFYDIDNRILTTAGAPRKIVVDREAGSRQLRLWGALPPRDKGEVQLLGIDDPALYGARALYDALARRGVNVTGRAVARHLFPNQQEDPAGGGVELARRTSAPLFEDLRITDKVSQNLHAELLLRAVARARRNIGSREAVLEEMKAFLDEVGVERAKYNLNDGSGLSRLNLVSPAAVVKLLRYMHGREHWIDFLPVAGQDGTLSGRFAGSRAAGRIRAKTGSLSHVAALAGYAERRDGKVLVFSILVNNYSGHSGEIRGVIDTICSLMTE